MILKPLLTEKTMSRIKKRKYTFVVDKEANKPEIKKTVAAMFGVKVKEVNIIRRHPEKILRRFRYSGTKPGSKIAVVTLEKDQKIPGFEVPKEEKSAKSEQGEKIEKSGKVIKSQA